jgi:hypothetical protein
LKLERRKLAGQLRDARQQLEKERRRSAELTAELDQLKKKRMVSKPKRSASRSRKKAPAKRRPKSSP